MKKNFRKKEGETNREKEGGRERKRDRDRDERHLQKKERET